MRFSETSNFFLFAAGALPSAMAYIPLESRSNAELDLGNLDSMETFFEIMGLNGTAWEEITEYETYDVPAITEEDSKLSLLARQTDSGYCADLTGFSKILCDNMPTREAYWTAGGALFIWYGPEVLTKWCDAIAHVIKTARSLRQMQDGNDLNARLIARGGEPNTNYRFTVPFDVDGILGKRSFLDGETGQTVNLVLSNTYIFDANSQVIHYHSTNGMYSASFNENPESAAALARRGDEDIDKRQTYDYSIVIQATALTSATTIASAGCISDMVRHHIKYASEQNRFKCVPIDNRGSWRVALHVNINHGLDNHGEKGECCDFY